MLSLLIFLIAGSLLIILKPPEFARKLGIKNSIQPQTALTSAMDDPEENLSSRAMEVDTPKLEQNVEPVVEVVEEEMMIPVVIEELSIEKQLVAKAKVRVNKRVETREVEVCIPIEYEEVLVERIPIDRLLEEGEAIPTIREEGDTFIIPIIGEVVIMKKTAHVKEALEATKERFTEQFVRTYPLREEVVDVRRVGIDTYLDTPSREGNGPVSQEIPAGSPRLQKNPDLVDEVMIPVAVEELQIEKLKRLKGKVIVDKRVKTREEAIEVPLVKEKIHIDVIPKSDLPEDTLLTPIHEEERLFLPLIREEATTEKHLLWVEDVRISKRIITENQKKTVTLRTEVVDIERFPLI